MHILPSQKMDRLEQALAPLHQKYDRIAKMLRVPFRSIGFFKFLQGIPVHPTRESLYYAVALLDTNDPKMCQRGVEIIQTILTLQDKDSRSQTYGLWPKYLEEKPFKIVQPDPNWREFLATQLLQVALNHRDRLSPNLIAKIDEAILCAAYNIKQRNIPLEYTNIAIMGIYVTLLTGQIYKINYLYNYGINRLEQFCQYILEQGGFPEYNSPDYTIIALEILGRLRLYAKNVNNAKIGELLEVLYRLSWREIATHFHPPTRQWAGPHSRSYSTLLKKEVLALIERSTSEQINFGIVEKYPTLDEHRLSLPCPDDLETLFLQLNHPRTVTQTLSEKSPKQVLTTYLAPSFALGSVNYSDFWHQRRPLLVYWGTHKKPSYLRLRCLYNNVDYAAAQFFSVQNQGNVLCGVSFATDINPINPYLSQNTKSNSTLLLKDLRLRFEFGGSIDMNSLRTQLSSLATLDSSLCLCFDDLSIQIRIPYAQFGESTGKWEIHQDSQCFYLDLLLWAGKKQVLDLSHLSQGAIAFALKVTTEKILSSEVSINLVDNWLETEWENLHLKLWTKPAKQQFLNISTFSSDIDK
ncbi:hypothetical protein ACE1CI_16010 [Aerosakkonemataceae cyanobacterium BLCC-F50]|uniref:Uncharacterized protein n=1 Tax=Floridaenema flaviceps BLCC-F50 TaxID=3153642 RepID=A0ABV4XRS0_9CYAN